MAMTASLPCSETTVSFTLPFWTYKDCIRRVALRKDDLVPAVLTDAAAIVDPGEKRFRVE
jgi:hypothetical protein